MPGAGQCTRDPQSDGSMDARLPLNPCFFAQVCNLKLISSAELTKTYHHLFPVAAYVEAYFPAMGLEEKTCFGCCDKLLHVVRDGLDTQAS